MAAQPNPAPGAPPRAVLLDAMGTLLTFAPPAPLLRAALRERLGADPGPEGGAAPIRGEIAYSRAHLHAGRDAASLAALRRRCAEAMRPALGPPAAGAPAAVLTEALLGSLRFAAFPDAAPALRRLRAAGVRLVVVSNWDVSLHERLAETGLAGLIDGAIASAEAGSAKPEPAIFERALALAGVPREAAWHVGDSLEADVAGARAAGLLPLLLDRDGGADAPDGVHVVGTLADVAALAQYPPGARR
jgi:putative hydrolase of the HAD superfamily